MLKLKTLWSENRGFLLFMGLMFVFRSAIADWNYVPSSSMNPTLLAGDRVVVNKLAYSLRVPFTLQHVVRWDSPHRGDVITFDSPADEVNLIKRVVAVAGDTVSMRDNQLTINGQKVARTLIDQHAVLKTEQGALSAEIYGEKIGGVEFTTARLPLFNRLRDFEPVTVPIDHVLVLGDSRDNSQDSRFIGFIDSRRVTGQAVRVVMSHDVRHFYMPRVDRWWLPLHS